MSKKYLVFSVDFSGVSNRLFNELSKSGIELDICEIPKIWSLYIFAIILGFDINYKKWIQKSERKYNQLHKSIWGLSSN